VKVWWKSISDWLWECVFAAAALRPVKPRPEGWWDEQVQGRDAATAQFNADAKARAEILRNLIDQKKHGDQT
jgi:hypothetical protein